MKFTSTFFLALLIFTSVVNAQKLPNVQQTSIRAKKSPNNEVADTFEAYNHNTDIFYTLSNDDNKLYLTIKVIEPFIFKKIASGGLTLTISNGAKANENVSITYPTTKDSAPFYLVLNSTGGTATTTKNHNDSLKNALNAQMTNSLKVIEVTGVKAISDSLISIYNEYGIKANAFFDDQINYNYRLELPLKYLNNLSKISYKITLNGTIPKNAVTRLSGSGQNLLVMVEGKSPYVTPIINSPTYFSGEYELAK